ncbi:deleted in malignant brain tumors 1 protein-like [Heterodontus francisci]|uniref:deleted in malignant brain tumors 1 protein-like n=1 Tax=Heterodontus francisci TaxID=7792 RepID=UPI00355B5ED3
MQTFLTLSLLQLLNCRPGNSKADPSEMVKLRLVNGGSRCAGRVEIHYRGQWGTVNDYLWDLPDAAVVCRELGCGTAVSAPGQAHFGEGSGPIVTFFVECGGTEAALRDCKSAQWDHYPYPHSNDAGVICSGKPEPRLVGGMNRCSGRVEVLHGDQWGTLCGLYFDMEDANVVCEHLQCGTVNSIPGGAHFGKGTGPVWKENYRCLGNETRLWDCPVSSWEQFSFSHENDASVICNKNSKCWKYSAVPAASMVRERVSTFQFVDLSSGLRNLAVFLKEGGNKERMKGTLRDVVKDRRDEMAKRTMQNKNMLEWAK